jgi:transcriptional regulator GlxA family with amidase domain
MFFRSISAAAEAAWGVVSRLHLTAGFLIVRNIAIVHASARVVERKLDAMALAKRRSLTPMKSANPRRIVFAAFEGMRVLDLTGPLDAFSLANVMGGSGAQAGYSLRVVSERGGAVATSSGLAVSTESLSALDDAEIDTLIVAGGASALRHDSSRAVVEAWLESQKGLVAWIAERAPHIRRVCSVCTGTFLLAAARQLVGRTVTTHWAASKLLADCFPGVRVEPDRIFVQDGPVWTSGGVTSGIDLALALIEDDFGSEFALKTARFMVVFVKRPGGQSQFSVPLAAQSTGRGNFAALHAWMREHLAEDLRIEQLAEQAGMSRRTFMRSYTAATSGTPGKTIEAMRLEAARVALEATNKSLKQIARESGFGDEERMRRVFQRQLGVNPVEYRAHFSSPAAPRRRHEAANKVGLTVN